MKRVVVGMSGGVDSSVAALLLQRQGYDVVGLFMNNWEEEEDGCCTAAEDYRDALDVCGKIGVPLYSINLAKQYYDRVFQTFLHEYAAGRTPNPDVLCNREIKFDAFKQKAAELGADYIATGHYCRISDDFTTLKKAADANKDQTYFLNQVRTEQLDRVLFPVGNLHKPEVRKIAHEAGLVTERKKDSTGICFIGERNFKRFLMQYLPAQAGDIVDTSGKTVGRHDGLMYYTLGQRRGLGVGGVKGEAENRWYVIGKDLEQNRLLVSCGEGEELLSDGCTVTDFNVIGAPVSGTFDCTAKLRYRQPEQLVTATVDGSRVTLRFATRQRAVTPGQYAVLYLGERCVGGGVIDSTV